MMLSATLNLTLWAQPTRSIDKQSFWLNKTYPNQVFDAVMVGDSRLYRGFSPTQIEAKLSGISLHNFGYSSARLTPDLLDAATTHIDPKSSSPIVLIAVTAHSLTQPKQGGDNPHYDGFAQRNRATIWLSQRSSWVSRTAWPAWIDDPTDRLLMARQGAGSVHYRETFDARGFVASSTLPQDPKRALASYRQLLKESPVQNQRLKALAEWVQQKVAMGVSVVAFVPPRPPAMREVERQVGGWSKADVKDQLKVAGADWIDLKWEGLSSYDGSHLDEESAQIASKRLGIALEKILKTDRRNDR